MRIHFLIVISINDEGQSTFECLFNFKYINAEKQTLKMFIDVFLFEVFLHYRNSKFIKFLKIF